MMEECNAGNDRMMITNVHLVKVAVYIAPDSSKGEIMTFKNNILG